MLEVQERIESVQGDDLIMYKIPGFNSVADFARSVGLKPDTVRNQMRQGVDMHLRVFTFVSGIKSFVPLLPIDAKDINFIINIYM